MTMRPFSEQRCFNHAAREAAARCPSCGRFFCRECVTEHDDRVLCAKCVEKLASTSAAGKSRLAGAARLFQFGCAALIGWLFFYWVGQTLLSFDDAFHEGTVWKERWWP